jgi:hypothetical protein
VVPGLPAFQPLDQEARWRPTGRHLTGGWSPSSSSGEHHALRFAAQMQDVRPRNAPAVQGATYARSLGDPMAIGTRT